MDPIAQFKHTQKASWAGFAALENATGTTAPHLVAFAGIGADTEVLDVGCGTGVVALTAARLGARATGVDLTPELLARAKENAALMQLDVTWHEGDAEALPVEDARYDAVVSQFGHMFAPRPQLAVAEMLRALRPGGTLAFATWPPDRFVGRMFALVGSYAPPPPPGVAPPTQWGDPEVIRARLGDAVTDVTFERGTMRLQTLSVQHYRAFMEQGIGPTHRLLGELDRSDPARATALRRELEQLAAEYFEHNTVRQDYLLTRATKA